MTAYLSSHLDISKMTALLLIAIVLLFPGYSASESEQRDCTGDDLFDGCTTPALRNAYPITSLDKLLQIQCNESKDDCHLVRINARHSIYNM